MKIRVCEEIPVSSVYHQDCILGRMGKGGGYHMKTIQNGINTVFYRIIIYLFLSEIIFSSIQTWGSYNGAKSCSWPISAQQAKNNIFHSCPEVYNPACATACDQQLQLHMTSLGTERIGYLWKSSPEGHQCHKPMETSWWLHFVFGVSLTWKKNKHQKTHR